MAKEILRGKKKGQTRERGKGRKKIDR